MLVNRHPSSATAHVQADPFAGSYKPAPVGAGIEDVVAFSAGSRAISYGTLFGLVVVSAAVVATGVYAFGVDRPHQIGVDSPTNPYFAKTVELFSVYDDQYVETTCTGAFVGATGQILTATHCFQEPNICDFNTTLRDYPLDELTYYAEVAGVNGGSDRRTFEVRVLGWSGVTDVMVLQTQILDVIDPNTLIPPEDLKRTGGSGRQLPGGFEPYSIEITRQPHFSFADSTNAQRGDPVMTLAYDLAFMKKLGHKGEIQAVNTDRGTDFVVSVDQVFYDGNSQDGSSGAGVWDHNGQLVLAPISYGWYDGDNVFAVSGTSSRVSRHVVRRILSSNFAPSNNQTNKLLVASLGIVTFRANDGINLLEYNPAYFNSNQMPNHGVAFTFLASQIWFDFVNTYLTSACLDSAYQVNKPALLGAPLDTIIEGAPPLVFPSRPVNNMSCLPFITGIEATLDRNDWVEIGSDAGSSSISGVILGKDKQPGDDVRVRIRCINPVNSTVAARNWIAVYRVTLEQIDPLWDTTSGGNTIFGNYASHAHVNISSHMVYLSSAVPRPRFLSHHRPRPNGNPSSGQGRRTGAQVQIQSAPVDMDLSDLPTVADLYLSYEAGFTDEDAYGGKRRSYPSKPTLEELAAMARPIVERRRHQRKFPAPAAGKASKFHPVPAVASRSNHPVRKH